MTVEYTLRRSTVPERFPNAIRYYRIRAGLTQRRLGELVGHDRSVVSSWERGRVLPTVPNLFLLAKALDTLTEALYAGLYCPYPRGRRETKTTDA